MTAITPGGLKVARFYSHLPGLLNRNSKEFCKPYSVRDLLNFSLVLMKRFASGS